MPTTKTEAPVSDITTTETKKDVMGIERDDQNARVSFTPDNNLMIITIPLARMSSATAHGFIYLLNDIVRDWYKQRIEIMNRNKVVTGKAVSSFNFKQGLSKIFK